jgi:3D (Asp-Asp-Asp) domain-containing protein
MLKLILTVMLGLFLINLPSFSAPLQTYASSSSDVLGESVGPTEATPSGVLAAAEPIHTTSRFESKIEKEIDKIARKVVYKDDPDRELDDNVTLQEGKDGKRIRTYTVLYYEGEEYSRELSKVEVIPPEDQIIDKGTKIVWRTLETQDGEIHYWRKLRVYATQYDSHCPGCDDWTAIGMHQGYGVVAVDPSVIKMRSKFYVPGYGQAVAGDTGGAIKGNRIDVGFPDAHTSGWYSHYVDIYLE